MSTVQALKLEDPEGSVLIVTRIEDAAYTLTIGNIATDDDGNPLPFRLFEEDRGKLRDFLRALA